MSSHREAPAISRDPVADNTDLYAFVSPDDPGTVTIISNYLPLEAPYGGPNFFEFGPDVRYRINIDNDGDGDADVIYEFAFETQVGNPNSFLYNSGPILTIDSGSWNRKQFYSVTRISRDRRQVLGAGLACPPCNIGPLSTPDYDMLASQAIHTLPGVVPCSRDSGPRASTSISVRSSTWGPCGRSRTCTRRSVFRRWRLRPASTEPTTSACTRSR